MSESTSEFEVVGCSHIHSLFSDGSGSVPDLVEAAEEAGLDFIILTDHNSIKARHLGLGGWHGRVLVIVGEELGRNKGHFLAVDCKKRIHHQSSDPKDLIHDIHEDGGLSFLVHPDGKPKPEFGIDDSRWKVRAAMGLTGIEVWSYMYDWIRDTHWWNLPFHIARPNAALCPPHPDTLRTWDLLSKEERLVGIGGVDAHAKPVLPKLKIFPYREMFQTIRNHVILNRSFSGCPIKDKKTVLEALERGRCFVSMDQPFDSGGFRFQARYAGRECGMGDRIPFQKGEIIAFSGRCPQAARLTLLRDGEVCFEGSAEAWEYEATEPGVYRAEVWKDGRPWVFANPVVFIRK